MTKTQILIGSLSNDLFRVASCTVNGSIKNASRFTQEAKRWAVPLQKQKVAEHIKKIAQEVSSFTDDEVTLEQAERCLMYGILLQNYVLQTLKKNPGKVY
ncbi:MAG: hypothetical protein ABIJ05_00970 [Patescibacteria group bacterium]